MKKESWITSFDGTQIGYSIQGEGKNVIALCNGLSTTDSYWKYLVQHLSPRYRVLTWDYRGHGISHPPVAREEIRIDSHAKDLKHILDAERIDCPAIGGFSMGVQVCLEFYRLFPDRCTALILTAGPSGKPLESIYSFRKLPSKILPYILPFGVSLKKPIHIPVKFLVQSPFIYPFCIATRMISPAATREDMRAHFNSIARIDIGLFLRMVKAMDDHDAGDILPRVKIPTLVVAGTADMFTRYWAQEKTYRSIPGAEMLKVPLGTHVTPIEQPELINMRIDKFLEERVWPTKKLRRKSAPLSRQHARARRGSPPSKKKSPDRKAKNPSRSGTKGKSPRQ